MRLRVLAATSIVAAGGLAGCTEDGPPDGEPGLGPIPIVRTVKDIALPLDAYDFTPEQRQTVVFASLILTEQCAARYGVSAPAIPPPYGAYPALRAARIEPVEALRR